MSEEWRAFARQIADLKRQLAEVTRERDQYKAAYELQDLQRKFNHQGGDHEQPSQPRCASL